MSLLPFSHPSVSPASVSSFTDMETTDSLIEAIKKFEGGVIVVSHDLYFLESVAQFFWAVGEKKVVVFDDFEEAKKHSYKEIKKELKSNMKADRADKDERKGDKEDRKGDKEDKKGEKEDRKEKKEHKKKKKERDD